MQKPKATVFEFSSYKFEPAESRIFFNYKQEFKGKNPIFYQEKIVLPQPINLDKIPKAILEKLLSGLHIVLGASYWKFYCAPKIKVPYFLAKEEADFWNTIYKNGFGEFFYRNNLNPKISPKFPFSKTVKPISTSLESAEKFLVALSGGKDSLVALELLKEHQIFPDALFTQTSLPAQAQKQTEFVDKLTQKAGANLSKIQRFLDEKVLETHQYNGHIPISAVYAFLGIFYSVLYGYSNFVVANEFSSNFGNIKYKGLNINHQWSKSSEFEALFQNYLRNFVTPNINYFSLLRPFYEIRIAQIFSKHNQYFPYFSSCNKNFKISNGQEQKNLWCGECPKCAFAFLLLSAFLKKEELIGIFGKNLFDDKKLLPTFKDILGFGKLKPFDCVGTFEESRVALFLAKKEFLDSSVVKEFLPKIKNPEKLAKKVFMAQNSFAPDYVKFLGLKNALILGYGKEGKVTEEYLKLNYPNLQIGIADKSISKDYLKKQSGFDIAIKTPGIAKKLVKIPYTTATNIFFSEIKNRGNKLIGVTGSKGKSTTASLIYEILKHAGKDVELLGNIGFPMLATLLKPGFGEKIFVLELSSAQLEDLNFSPDIAVLTNLFPEHMDYHGNLENYYFAKKNIIKFQNSNSFFVFNSQNKLSNLWLKNYRGRAVPFDNFFDIKKTKILLQGAHNKDNIRAAISVAKLFGVSDSNIKTAVENFKPLPHRLEFVGEFFGIKFYDDAISTTPESTIQAIKTIKNIGTIFLGGQDRGYNFRQLEKELKKYKIKNVVLFPNSGKKIIKGKKHFNTLETKSMQEAVKFAFKNTEKGRVCLLSCASPSYSLWKNFEEKGDEFKKFVLKYGSNEKTF